MDWFKTKKVVTQPGGSTPAIPPKRKLRIRGEKPSGTEGGDERIDVGYEASWSGIVEADESDD